MNDLFSIAAETLFSSLGNQSAKLESLSTQSLSAGITKYTKGDYKGAALDFKRAFGLSPYSNYAVDATKYLAMSQVKMGDTQEAIKTYENALKLHSNNDTMYTALGNLYIGEGRTGDAITAYENAVRVYDDANNRFSLGQGYLQAGRHADAANQFGKVIDMEPKSPNGYYGMGQVLSAQKKYTEAIAQFERAIGRNEDFYAAYAEMGYAYMDSGQKDKAEEILSFLKNNDESLAATLDDYLNKMTQPKILFAWPDSSFPYALGPKTPVSGLSSYLANANAQQGLSVTFQFNRSMDRESVENPLNWTIERSKGNGVGTDYNFGLTVPDTEARISPYPTSIYYDEKKLSATVYFGVAQNSTLTATIDPSRMVFSFSGNDSDGNTMDSKYDQYMGFSGTF